MGFLVCNGAMCQCSFGAAPSSLAVLPAKRVNATNLPAATIQDFIPMTNIMPFGMCSSLSNPAVSAATTAALGVLTPQPCMPVVSAPWAPGSSTVMIGGVPALNSTSRAMCAWGGIISINNVPQQSVNVP